MLSRRSAVTLAGAALATAACDRAADRTPDGVGAPKLVSGSLTSRHLPGTDVTWRMALPNSAPRGLVVALHGYGAQAATMIGGVALADHVDRTKLAVAAVDGGNSYWHRRRDGTDSGSMVIDDLIPLALGKAGLPATSAVGLLGFSMGGYGALLLATQLGKDRVFGVVAESAALFLDPGESAKGAFDDREDFIAHDVFRRLDDLAGIPIRLECGVDDYFITANRELAKLLPHAEETFDAGGHTLEYWHDHAPAQMDWLARLAPPT